MPFEYILGNLLARNDGAVGALFLDDSGETVDLACAEFTPTQLRIVGAYLGICFRHLERLAETTELGEPELLHVVHRGLHIFATPVAEGYCLAMIQRHPKLVAASWRTLAAAREEILQELFNR